MPSAEIFRIERLFGKFIEVAPLSGLDLSASGRETFLPSIRNIRQSLKITPVADEARPSPNSYVVQDVNDTVDVALTSLITENKLFKYVDQQSARYSARGFHNENRVTVHSVLIDMVTFDPRFFTEELSKDHSIILEKSQSLLHLWIIAQNELDSYKPRIDNLRQHYFKEKEEVNPNFQSSLVNALDFLGCHKETRAFALSTAQKELGWFCEAQTQNPQLGHRTLEKKHPLMLKNDRDSMPFKNPLTDINLPTFLKTYQTYLTTMSIQHYTDVGSAAEA